jgi:hypothetical protein
MRKNIALAGQALSLAIIQFLLDKYPIYIHSHPGLSFRDRVIWQYFSKPNFKPASFQAARGLVCFVVV